MGWNQENAGYIEPIQGPVIRPAAGGAADENSDHRHRDSGAEAGSARCRAAATISCGDGSAVYCAYGDYDFSRSHGNHSPPGTLGSPMKAEFFVVGWPYRWLAFPAF